MKKSTSYVKKQNHAPDCKCSFCGQKYNSVPFKSGFVCESCIDYLKEAYTDDPSDASLSGDDEK